MSRQRTVLQCAIFAVVANLDSIAGAQSPAKTLQTASVPSKSLPASGRLVRSFDATGVRKVVLRASDAEQMELKTVAGSRSITISGVPEGGAEGYHSPDPNWRETPLGVGALTSRPGRLARRW